MNPSTSEIERGAWRRLAANWRVYAMDGALLGLFMVSACAVVTVVEHPASPVRMVFASQTGRRAIVGVMMGVTAVSLIYSRWGRRSGALMNPAVTIGHWRAGRITRWDAVFYCLAQIVGGTLGVGLMAVPGGRWVGHREVNYAATLPGASGLLVAWVAEFVISMGLMIVVTGVNRSERLRPYTGWFAGSMVAVYITIEAPLSGMSMNPARTLASAVFANVWTGWWVYLTAPLLGMLGGIEVWRVLARGVGGTRPCGKFVHAGQCFLRCECGRGGQRAIPERAGHVRGIGCEGQAVHSRSL
jgi:aquaporin Z